MMQWLRRKIIRIMGNVYVWLDKGIKHDTAKILGANIDDDLQIKSRKELCNHIEDKFSWDRDSFWELDSTQKIRLSCQVARDYELNVGYKIGEE
tara:strand:- start:287 stop:568 length:282 start_codon:yes stop_codon:yes gene_type:complete